MKKFIIDQSTMIAAVETDHAGDCRYGFAAKTDNMNANHPVHLVNARNGKLSAAKKWADAYRRMDWLPTATEINPGEFLLKD